MTPTMELNDRLEKAEARVAVLENQLRRVTGREPGEVDYILPWCTHHPKHIIMSTCNDLPAPAASVSALPPTGDAEPCYDLESCTGCRDHRPSRGPVLPREAKPALSFKLRVVVDDDGSTFTVPVLLNEGEALSKFDIVYAREGVRAAVSFEPTPAVMGVPTGCVAEEDK